jgi:hypothetical protein
MAVYPPEDWDEEEALGFVAHRPLEQVKPREWVQPERRQTEPQDDSKE